MRRQNKKANAGNPLGLLFEGNARNTNAHNALGALAASTETQLENIKDYQDAIAALADDIPVLAMPIRAELLPSLAELDATVGTVSQRLDQLTPAFQHSGEAAKNFGQAASMAFIRAADASKEAVVAEGARLAATVGSRRVAAGIEAVWETAKGIAALAEWDFRGAALHFMSAAEYGIIAGTSAHGRGGAGGGVPRGRPVLNAEGAGIGSRESGVGGRGGSGGGSTVILNIQGDFLSAPETVERLAGLLSDAVDRRDVVLRASHVKDSTLTRDSLNG